MGGDRRIWFVVGCESSGGVSEADLTVCLRLCRQCNVAPPLHLSPPSPVRLPSSSLISPATLPSVRPLPLRVLVVMST